MMEFLEWLQENKISTTGKYRGKRWGSVGQTKDGDWHIRVCVQYDEYLEPVLSEESAALQQLIRMRTGHEGCGRCIDGKCAFTGFDLINPNEADRACEKADKIPNQGNSGGTNSEMQLYKNIKTR